MRAVAVVTIPTLALWYKNKDKEWYRQLPWTEKFLYYNIEAGDDVFRVPKPQEWGAYFSVIPEAIADAMYEQDPEAAIEAFKFVAEVQNPMDYPPLLRAAKEQWANRVEFFDTPIVPRSQEDLLPGDQKGPYTSRLAELLGKAAPDTISPRRVDALVAALGGTVARELMQSTGRVGSGTGKEFERSDLPIIGRLFRRGGQFSSAALSLNEFYKHLNYYDAAANSSGADGEIKRYAKILRKRHEQIKRSMDRAHAESSMTERH
jgi:hypothetical protein